MGKKGLAALLVPVTALVLAAPAQADQKSFLAALQGHGINLHDQSGAIADGFGVCVRIQRGNTADQAKAWLQKKNPQLSDSSAAFVVDAAIANLC